jgi:hypothetical protein
MPKAAAVVFADTQSHADLARVVNAMVTVREFKEAGDEARLAFDGAGTRWIPELSKPEHRSHRLYEDVKDRIAGACAFCAGRSASGRPSRRPASRWSTSTGATRACASSSRMASRC